MSPAGRAGAPYLATTVRATTRRHRRATLGFCGFRGLTEATFSTEQAARNHAVRLSHDPGVLAAGVVSFVVDGLGSRSGIALYR